MNRINPSNIIMKIRKYNTTISKIKSGFRLNENDI